jgi:UDP-GlcNAc:undecaprenyl-phosphate GlcNAc-1-phosphate transferase
VPAFGGLGVVGATVLGTAAAIGLGSMNVVDGGAVIALVGVLFVLGVADDRGSLSPLVRLAVEAAAGAGFVAIVAAGQPLPLHLGAIALAIVAVPLAVNATNLVDNADGLAASLSAVTAATIAAAPFALGIPAEVALPLAIVGSLLAFLQMNRPPARTFMGDGGSLGLGGGLAAAAILLLDGARTAGTIPALAALAVIVLAFSAQLMDVALVVTSRLRRGESPFRGGTDHTSHRLLRAGLTASGMLFVVVVAASLLGLVGLIGGSLATHGGTLSGLLLTAAALGLALAVEIVLAHRLPHAPPPPDDAEAPPPAPRRPPVADIDGPLPRLQARRR